MFYNSLWDIGLGECNKGMAMDTGQCTPSHAHDNWDNKTGFS